MRNRWQTPPGLAFTSEHKQEEYHTYPIVVSIVLYHVLPRNGIHIFIRFFPSSCPSNFQCFAWCFPLSKRRSTSLMQRVGHMCHPRHSGGSGGLRAPLRRLGGARDGGCVAVGSRRSSLFDSRSSSFSSGGIASWRPSSFIQ